MRVLPEPSEVRDVSKLDDRALRLRPHLHDSVPLIHADQVWNGVPGYTGRGVIVGIIDTGIDISHGSFRRLDAIGSTRILRLWDQTVVPANKPPTNFNNRRGKAINVAYGSEFTFQELNQALKNFPSPKLLPGIEAGSVNDEFENEEEIVRPVGHPAFRRTIEKRVVPHGSHVAGTAAGSGLQAGNCHDPGYYVGVAKDADLVVVKYRPDALSAMEAIEYIAHFAADPVNFVDGKPRPVVINCSFGLGLGSAGARAFDKNVDAFLQDSVGLVLVVSTGNEADGALHRQIKVPANGTGVFEFRILDGDKKPDEILLSYTGAAELTLTLSSSTLGKSVGPLAPQLADHVVPVGVQQLTVHSEPAPDPETNKREIRLTLVPSATTGQIVAGNWRIELHNTALVEAVVDAFSASEDLFAMFSGTPNDLDRSNTVKSPASAKNVIAVGNYDGYAKQVAITSGRGAPGVVAAKDVKPDVVAPGTGIFGPNGGARYGNLSDCCVDFYVPTSGTSMAAPHVTGVVALMLERNPTLSYVQVKQILRETADPPPNGVAVPNNEWGFGLVNAQKAVAKVTPLAAPLVPDPVPPLPGPPAPAPHLQPFFAAPDGAERTRAAGPRFGVNAPLLAERLRSLVPLVSQSPALQVLLSMVSTHVDEVRRLIDHNRRVGAVWCGRGGHQLVRYLLAQSRVELDPLLPEAIGGFAVRELLARMLAILRRFGGEALRADVARYGALFVAFPGSRLCDLDPIANPSA